MELGPFPLEPTWSGAAGLGPVSSGLLDVLRVESWAVAVVRRLSTPGACRRGWSDLVGHALPFLHFLTVSGPYSQVCGVLSL